MKKSLLFFLMAAIGGVFVSCSDDPAPDPHIVGEWSLEGYELTNFASDFASFDPTQIPLGALFGYEYSTLNLANDDTFEERTKPLGGTTNVSTGTWSFDEEYLTLNYDDATDPFEAKIERNEDDLMWYSFSFTFLLVSDPTFEHLSDSLGSDQAAAEFLNGLSDEEYEKRLSPAVCDWIWKYVREE